MIYFHANAEDILKTNGLLDTMAEKLQVHIIAVEYPGYSIYNKNQQKRSKKYHNPLFDRKSNIHFKFPQHKKQSDNQKDSKSKKNYEKEMLSK